MPLLLFFQKVSFMYKNQYFYIFCDYSNMVKYQKLQYYLPRESMRNNGFSKWHDSWEHGKIIHFLRFFTISESYYFLWALSFSRILKEVIIKNKWTTMFNIYKRQKNYCLQGLYSEGATRIRKRKSLLQTPFNNYYDIKYSYSFTFTRKTLIGDGQLLC